MSDITIEVRGREKTGKNHNRRARASGQIPAVVYGAKLDSLPIEVEDRVVQQLLRTSGENTVFLLKLEGTKQSRHAMIRDLQYDPRTGRLLHIDFQRIVLDQKIRVRIPIEVTGVAEGVKNEGGMLDFVTRELEVECLPGDIPAQLQLDVSELHVGQHVEAGAVLVPEGVSLLDDPEKTVVSVAKARLAAEEEVEEEAEADLIEALRRARSDLEAHAVELADANEEITCLLEELHEARRERPGQSGLRSV